MLLAGRHPGASIGAGGYRRSGYRGRRGHCRNRRGNHRAAIFIALGLLSARIGDRPLAARFPARIPGAPGELVDSATAYAYSRALAAASPRVRVFTIGRSEEGRDIVLLAIADEQGIRDLDRLKAATAALADPRKTDPAAAERIIAGARPIYYFNAALHSDETGSTETMLELAYRLAVSEQPMIRRIRENLVVLINPVSNPDGRDKQVEWFYRYLKGKTDLRHLAAPGAALLVAATRLVDINRDAIQLAHETTKAVQRMFFDWHPQVVHDLHESVALLVTWNGTGPDQRGHRSRELRRAPRDELSRGHDAHRIRHARGMDLEFRR